MRTVPAASVHRPRSSEPRVGRVAGTPALGAAVRKARQHADLTLAELARRVSSSAASLHGIEDGSRSVAIELLQRIADATGAEPALLFREAGAVPGRLTAELLSDDLAGALSQGGLRGESRIALRRIHLGSRAGDYTSRPGASDGRAVDIEGVLFKRLLIDFAPDPESDGYARFTSADFIAYPSDLDEDGQRLRKRMMLAHMAGHAILAHDLGRTPQCHQRRGGVSEAEASWLGGCLLLPRPELVSTFRLIEGKYDVDDPDDFGELLADLARRCDVPVWLAARHLADTGVLLSAAGLDDL